ncbi:hypothetical protein KY290_005139 [Solanum tuberosum]|uniref:Uncharacterized protein n=1 Tax=Solanum tuberosum TaxID=4113 RepID=A0ABQ7WFQ3_SOLTU|nr:hypothetical protein KY284_005253 [Solanum tuberosum]KAH0778712.1 hypothetical protein KY290_005139 [Solanum tuberosum]
MNMKEDLFEVNPTAANRSVLMLAHGEYIKYLHYEEEFWRQKISKEDGRRAETEEDIGNEALNFFQKQFADSGTDSELTLLHHIHPQITADDNALLITTPDAEEIKKLVFELNGDSACGPDGFT